MKNRRTETTGHGDFMPLQSKGYEGEVISGGATYSAAEWRQAEEAWRAIQDYGGGVEGYLLAMRALRKHRPDPS